MNGGDYGFYQRLIPLAAMGVLAPGSAHSKTSAQPTINASGIFLAHMSAESLSNISHSPTKLRKPKKTQENPGNPNKILENPRKLEKNQETPLKPKYHSNTH